MDPTELFTSLLVHIAMRYPRVHGALLLNSLIVSVLRREWLSIPYLGVMLRVMIRLSLLTPTGALGTFKFPLAGVSWPAGTEDKIVEAGRRNALRVDRPSVVGPAASPPALPSSDEPTPPEGTRASVVPIQPDGSGSSSG